MLHKKLDEITEADFRLLIENNIQERKTLEYKSNIPENSDAGKKEFLADISSLANTEGGDLIFGLLEKDGILQSNFGIEIENIDAEIARLENIVRDGISPRISLEIKAIKIYDNKHVVVVRTKASLEAPHRVVFKGHDKFYKRNSNGKYPMDVSELRSTFLQSGELIEHIKRFRIARVSDIKASDTPLILENTSAFWTIHIVPLTAFSTSFRITTKELQELNTGKHNDYFQPLRTASWNQRINLDGAIAYTFKNDGEIFSYTQLYRDGKIEGFDNLTFATNTQSEKRVLPMSTIETDTMKYVEKMLKMLSFFDVQSPYYVFLSLVGVKGFTVPDPIGYFPSEEVIVQNELLLPEVIIENLSDNIASKFQPVFDMIWNAAGVSNSLNYDDHGNYKKK